MARVEAATDVGRLDHGDQLFWKRGLEVPRIDPGRSEAVPLPLNEFV